MLDADVSVDRSLDSPLYLSIVMEDLTVPASLFEEGSFAKVHVSLAVADSGGYQLDATLTSTVTWAAMTF